MFIRCKLDRQKDSTPFYKMYLPLLPVCGGKPADIYFLIDMSNSIWEPDFKKQLNFVSNVIGAFDLGSGRTRIGIIMFSDKVHLEVPLNNAFSRPELQEKVRQLSKMNGGTNTGLAVEYLRTTGFSLANARQDVAHIAIVITDGQSMHPTKTSKEAALAHKEGIYIFAVGVGNSTGQYGQELSDLASDPDDNFKFEVDNYDVLHHMRNILAVKTCQIPVTGRYYLHKLYSYYRRNIGIRFCSRDI